MTILVPSFTFSGDSRITMSGVSFTEEEARLIVDTLCFNPHPCEVVTVILYREFNAQVDSLVPGFIVVADEMGADKVGARTGTWLFTAVYIDWVEHVVKNLVSTGAEK